jgi:hypothetical protein
MKHQQFCEPEIDKLVHQLMVGVIFAYDLSLSLPRDHWEGINKKKNIEKVLHHALNDV